MQLTDDEIAFVEAIRHGSINPANLAALFAFMLQLLPIIIPLFTGGKTGEKP